MIEVSETMETRLTKGDVAVIWNEADKDYLRIRLVGAPTLISWGEARALAELLNEAIKRRGA